MRNHISFKQYNPSKPEKYGSLFKSLNDVNFTYQVLVSARRPEELPSPHYVSGNENYAKKLITTLNEKVSLQGRNVFMDRLYTSINLAQWLLDRKMACIRTLQSSRFGIPE